MPHTLQYRPILIDTLISNERIQSYQTVFHPADDTEKWRAAARQVAQSQDFQALMRKQNLTPSYADQPQFAADVARQEQAFNALVPKLNLKP